MPFKASKSFDLLERQAELQRQFYSQYPVEMPAPMPPMLEICEYWDDFVIVCEDGDYYKVPYTTQGDQVTYADRSQWVKSMSVETWVAVKALASGELDVLAMPFVGKDSDGQWFDADTEIMPGDFSTPLPIYQHGIQQGMKGYQGKIEILGKTVPGSLTKQSDGWHIRVVLDMANKLARGVWEAAKKGLVAVSSGSVAHLARLEIGGKYVPYEKDKPGRIAVWPLAEISLWEKGNGNAQPASRFATALPVVKAIYRDAGVKFPEINDAALSQAEQAAKLARRKIVQDAINYLNKAK